jgi:hypothetical protein
MDGECAIAAIRKLRARDGAIQQIPMEVEEAGALVWQ